MKKLLYIISLFFMFGCSNSEQRDSQTVEKINLNGAWEFYHAQTEQWYSAKVPGVIHTDLIANKLIEDPYWETNEQELQWIEKIDWKYRKSFEVTPYPKLRSHFAEFLLRNSLKHFSFLNSSTCVSLKYGI